MMREVYSGSMFGRQLRRSMRRNWQLYLYAGLFLVGVALGAWVVRTGIQQASGPLWVIVSTFLSQRQGAGLVQVFTGAMASGLLFLGAAFVSGFCAIAQPVVLALPLLKGAGFGILAGYVYATRQWLGVGYVAAVLLPGALISALVLILACREALMLSLGLMSVSTSTGKEEPLAVRRYCLSFLLLGIGMLLAAAVDAGACFAWNSLLGPWL